MGTIKKILSFSWIKDAGYWNTKTPPFFDPVRAQIVVLGEFTHTCHVGLQKYTISYREHVTRRVEIQYSSSKLGSLLYIFLSEEIINRRIRPPRAWWNNNKTRRRLSRANTRSLQSAPYPSL